MIRLFFIIFVCIFCNCACNDGDISRKFIAAHGNDDFGAFKDYSVFIRSWEERGKNACILTKHRNDTGVCRDWYVIIVAIASNTIIETRYNDKTNELACNMDTLFARKLALKLISYGVDRIRVDFDNNVFISLKYDEQPAELIRFANKRFITDKYKDYRSVENGWYERID